jgi:hypothetical protein
MTFISFQAPKSNFDTMNEQIFARKEIALRTAKYIDIANPIFAFKKLQ